MEELFNKQIAGLERAHFLVLYWTALGEDHKKAYNMTNVFDDLKACGVTRTKQSAVAFVDALAALCFVDLRGESNRKNLYLTEFGAQALQRLAASAKYSLEKSQSIEG